MGLAAGLARFGGLRGGAWGYPGYRRYLTAQAVSLVGTWMQSAAQAWLVLELTGSATRLGVVSAVQFLPVLFLSLVAGAVADRVPRARWLVGTQCALAATALALGLLTLTGRIRYWHVVVIAGLYGTFNTFDMPARHSFLADLVPREVLASAIGLHSAAFNVARLIGPAVAGATLSAVGSGPAFLINAASFLPVIAVLATLPAGWGRQGVSRGAGRPSLSSAGAELRRLAGFIREGLAYVRRTRPIRDSLLLLGIVSLFTMNFQVLVPVYAQRVLAQSAAGYGLLMAALGAGALVAALGMAAQQGVEPPPWRRSLGVALLGLSSLALAVTRSYPLAALLFAAGGWGMVSLNVGTNTLVQLSSEEALRGRVMSAYTLVLIGVGPFGSLWAGLLSDRLGVAAALGVGGAVALGAWLSFRPWRIRALQPGGPVAA